MGLRSLEGQWPWVWSYEAHEFPVQVKGTGTKIDFILKTVTYNERHECFLLAECKRVNPSLSDWCFLRTPRLTSDELALIEQVTFTDDGRIVPGPPDRTPYFPKVDSNDSSRRPYHVGLELRNREEQGESVGSGRGEIEGAATQLLRGLNGFVEFLSANPHAVRVPPPGLGVGRDRKISILPVIFTTASLWTTAVELGRADLSTGNFDVADLKPTRIKWLRYRYHQSPGIKHDVETATTNDGSIGQGSLMKLVESSFARDIMIVNADAAGEFLSCQF